MAYTKPFNFSNPIVDQNGIATDSFQREITELLRAVAVQSNPAVFTVTLQKITGGGTNGSLTIDAQGIVIEMVAPT